MVKNQYYKKRVLVTGGAGFIGSHLTEQLVASGAIVTVADNLTRGGLDKLRSIAGRFLFLKLDLRLEKNALNACNGQDIVFNLAALNTGVDYDKGRTHKMFEENVLLQLMPIRAAAVCGVQSFIQVSSASIYSTEAMEKRVPTKESDDGGSPEVSKLGYALAKRIGENLARWYVAESSLRVIIARFINVYGTRDNYDDLGHFIPAIVRKFVRAKNTIEIFGSGKQKRSFLHVDDAVNGLLLLGTKGVSGEAYNIDAQDERTIANVVRQIQKILHAEHVRLHFNTSLPEGSKRRLLDNTKIADLGWKSKYSLQQKLPEIVQDITKRLKK